MDRNHIRNILTFWILIRELQSNGSQWYYDSERFFVQILVSERYRKEGTDLQ